MSVHKKFGPFGPAVWPAIGISEYLVLLYRNIKIKRIYKIIKVKPKIQ